MAPSSCSGESLSELEDAIDLAIAAHCDSSRLPSHTCGAPTGDVTSPRRTAWWCCSAGLLSSATSVAGTAVTTPGTRHTRSTTPRGAGGGPDTHSAWRQRVATGFRTQVKVRSFGTSALSPKVRTIPLPRKGFNAAQISVAVDQVRNDTSGTVTGPASVFDNLDHDGDIVRRGAFSKPLGSGTHRYRWSGCKRQMTHASKSVMSSRPPRPPTVWRSRAGLIATPSSASRPAETPRTAECQV